MNDKVWGRSSYGELAQDILDLHKPDIVKDFSRVQAEAHELGESNVHFVNENLRLKQELKDMEERMAILEMGKDSLRESLGRLIKQRDDAMNAGGFCKKHEPTGGVRSCLVCACTKLTHILERIDYAMSEPNEMGVSDYALHYNEDEVLRKVKELVAKTKQ